jgi:hypothetical protein
VAVADADPLAVRLLYSPHRPEPPQHAFLLLDELGVEEALYGGAAGGGKSDAMLMSALRYVDVPGYAALLLRKTYADLNKPGALMDRAKFWLAGTDARWSEIDFRFTFPSGARLDFGYLKTANDKYNYQSAEYQFVGFDELTQFEEADYTYLFSRLRRPDLPDDERKVTEDLRRQVEALTHVPLRMRGATNPGGRGHAWVKRRFIDRLPNEDDPEDTPERCRARIFIPAKLTDNPHIDQVAYERNLANLSAVERARLRDGDWNADDGTLYFNGNGLDAALALGEEYDELAQAGELPPPAGEAIVLGLDFGDSTHAVLIYPLEAGGLWVVAAEPIEGREPADAADLICGPPDGPRIGSLGLLAHVPIWTGRKRAQDPLSWLSDVRYDAAGLQSKRTFAKRLRRRRRNLPFTAIPFGEYKRETALYLKRLVERAGEGHRVRILAISGRRARVLDRQLRGLVKDPKDRELWIKDDDHGPDALIAGAAPVMRRNRGKG